MAFKKHVFSIGIAVLALVLVIYGIRTFYQDPTIKCYPSKGILTQTECNTLEGEWNTYDSNQMPKPAPIDSSSNGYCDLNKKCEAIRNVYDSHVALIAYIIGLLLLVYGLKGKAIAEQTTAGFVGGGLLVIIYGTFTYWSHLEDVWRFALVLIIFILLVWVGNKYKAYLK